MEKQKEISLLNKRRKELSSRNSFFSLKKFQFIFKSNFKAKFSEGNWEGEGSKDAEWKTLFILSFNSGILLLLAKKGMENLILREFRSENNKIEFFSP